MKKKKGSINISLGNELNAQIVIGKNSCELQVILDLFCLGEIKQFPVKMFLSRKNQNLIGDFGNGGFLIMMLYLNTMYFRNNQPQQI